MDLTTLQAYSNSIINIIYFLFVPAVIAIAFITFLWGVYTYFILGADSETDREKGKQFILWGIIGFAVIISFWGLVYMASITLGLSPGGAPLQSPTI